MYKKCFYSRRVIYRRKRRLQKIDYDRNYSTSSSASSSSSSSSSDSGHETYDVNQYGQNAQSIASDIMTASNKEISAYENYHDDEYDNINILNDLQENALQQSPPLYDGCRFSTIKTVKMLMDFLISRVSLDKSNIINLMKLIKMILPVPNALPISWKSIMKLFGKVNLSSVTFKCSKCLNECGKTAFNTKNCTNDRCALYKRTLKTNEIVEIVNLDVRTQLKSIITRNINLIKQNYNLFPPSDITSASFYKSTTSNTNSNTITIVLHTDGAPLVRSAKLCIWPCFGSIVELPPPVREYQTNIILLALWSSKTKPDVNVFLKQTIDDIEYLITNGTTFYINNVEYNFVVRTQFFLADLPAKALFLKTTSFNGYYACNYCMTKGFWNGTSVIYPYNKNDLQLRTHREFIAAAKEAEEKTTEKRLANVQGVKGLSYLLRIFPYPIQIVLDYMHLVCLGHVSSIIKRWCKIIDKVDLLKIDNMLHSAKYPHNVHVTYTESIMAVEFWKAKHSRLFVLYLGVPIGISCLPILNASHWVVYCLLIKLLHTPQSGEDVNFAEKLIHLYCRTIVDVYDESLELYSLHAHLHLPSQVRLHGGLSTSSAFTFESCIKYLKSKVHGTKHLASQIAYWYDVETMVKTTQIEIAVPCGINKINIQNEQMNDYRHTLMNLIRTHGQDLDNIIFYKRYKQLFITFHTVLYDRPYKCRSYIVSYVTNSDGNDILSYGNIIIFYQYMNQFFAFIQKYYLSRKKLSHSIELPVEVCNKLDEMYPLLALSNDYDIIPVLTFRHKCIMIQFEDVYCLSELRIDFEHD
ncbi:unnamed protein product [Rotaria magnacalcarata]|uniref:Transposase domain-containing protein n=1 Tax=Rotaria magnacalcarata TaxID=392030 RepID=A0A816TT02_9BILA|nr:unnamed protein product [Rotaria magnacalcarata]